jgi:hypothetical protein
MPTKTRHKFSTWSVDQEVIPTRQTRALKRRHGARANPRPGRELARRPGARLFPLGNDNDRRGFPLIYNDNDVRPRA